MSGWDRRSPALLMGPSAKSFVYHEHTPECPSFKLSDSAAVMGFNGLSLTPISIFRARTDSWLLHFFRHRELDVWFGGISTRLEI